MRLSFVKHILLSLPLVCISSNYGGIGVAGRPSKGIERRATVCNGHAELCDKSFGQVTFVGAHDSYAIGTNSFSVNQDQNVTTQLNDGIRMLQMQAHMQDNDIHLCHTACQLYDGGTLHDYLGNVRDWLGGNPNEVLSLLIVNSDGLPPSQYDAVFRAVGLDVVSFIPPSSPLPVTEWPTLGSIIDSGKRLVTFMDTKADGSVPYIIDEFTNIWETAFDVVGPFDCSINRTSGTVDPASQMYLINHFLDKLVLNNPVPFVEKANTTNAATGDGSLGAQVDLCVQQHTVPPNFLLVDFYEFGGGSVFEVAAGINKVQYNPTQPIASPIPSGSGSASTPTGQSISIPLNDGAFSTLGLLSREMIFSLMSAVLSVIIGSSLIF